MNIGGDYITEEKRKALEEELEDLKGPKRQEILDVLQYAKSLGDLSENAEYHHAREEQGKLESRIAKIESILHSSQVISGGGGDVVTIGSKVVVQKVPIPPDRGSSTEVGKEKTYVIVGMEEADMALGKISNSSPLGVALFGKKKGDKASVKTPGGAAEYVIKSVS